MRFTYLPREETIVMSTNIKTKKYDMLERQSGVALLIHDFAEKTDQQQTYSFHHTVVDEEDEKNEAPKLTGEYSITLNGTCSVVKDGKKYILCIIAVYMCIVRYANTETKFNVIEPYYLCNETSHSWDLLEYVSFCDKTQNIDM